MRLVRSIVAFMLAISLALPPVGAAMSATSMPVMHDMHPASDHAGMHMDAATASPVMAMADAMDCCPGDAGGAAAPDDHAKCPMGFCCTGAIAPGEAVSWRAADLSARGSPVPIPADQVAASNGGSPPFRPPRV